jgi:hypothetical protein
VDGDMQANNHVAEMNTRRLQRRLDEALQAKQRLRRALFKQNKELKKALDARVTKVNK